MLKVTFINVGYGESILLEVWEKESKTVIVIDGGSAEDEEYSGDTGRIRAREYLVKKGITELDIAVVSHVHEDHVCGLEQFVEAGGRIKKLIVQRRLPQGAEFLLDGIGDAGTRKFINAMNSYQRLLCAMKEQGVEIIEADGSTGSLFHVAGLSAEVIAPSFERAERLSARCGDLCAMAGKAAFPAEAQALAYDLNGFSLTLMLSYQGKNILLPGDATPDCLLADDAFRRVLAADGLAAQVVKLAHHGQRDSVNETFVRAVSPDIVVTCASSDRRYESAHPDIYAQIEQWLGRKPAYLFSDCVDIAANILCRDLHSAVIITIGENSEGEIRCHCDMS